MEQRIESELLPTKTLNLVLIIGLTFDAILIIFSVDTLYREGKYFDLAIASIVFMLLLITIRRLNRNG